MAQAQEVRERAHLARCAPQLCLSTSYTGAGPHHPLRSSPLGDPRPGYLAAPVGGHRDRERSCSLTVTPRMVASEEPGLHNGFAGPQELKTCIKGIALVQIFAIANMVVDIRHELRLDVRQH